MTGFESHPCQGPVTPVRDRACAAPRPWILAAPVKPGPWRLLVYLWTYGPHWKPDDPLPAHGEVTVFPCKATMSREMGLSRDTIRTWLRRLKRDGWVRREGDRWALACGEPCALWMGEGVPLDPPVVEKEGFSQTPRGVQVDPGEGFSQTPLGVQPNPPIYPPVILQLDPPVKPPPVETAQAPLMLIPVDPEPDHVGELRALHERLRREALRGHGKRATSLPTKGKPGAALARRIGEAVDAYGVETCRAVLAWRADEWARDAGSLQWSREQAWSPRSMEFALARMDSPQGSPKTPQRSTRGLGVEAAPNAPASGLESLGSDDGWAMDIPGRAARVVVVNGS